MKKKTILFLRNMKDDFVFTASYVQSLADMLVNTGYDLFVYDFRKRKLMNLNQKTVRQYLPGLDLLDNTIFRIFFNFIVFIFFALTNKKKFNIVHVLYIRAEYLLSYRFVKILGDKLILSIFGSDINLYSSIKKHFKEIFFNADYILVTNEGLLNIFISKYMKENEIDLIKCKTKVMMFPLQSISILDGPFLANHSHKIKEKYGLTNSIVIFCGNTARIDFEQLYPLVKQIYKSHLLEKFNCKLVFPLTYGGDDGETKEFITFVRDYFSNDDIIFLTEYLSNNEMLQLIKLTDIYINVRKKDQLVATMIEAFFCRCEVIVGKWLPYNILERNGFYYHPLEKFEELPELLEKILKLRLDNKNCDLLDRNKKLVENLWAPEKTLKKWSEFYKNL